MAKESKCGGCFTVLAFVGSHVGLSVIAVLYIVFGGLIFQHIESDIETEQSLIFKDVSESSDILIREIWNMTRSNLIFDDKLYRELLRKKMFDHKSRYLSALLKGYSPYENLGEYWTLSGSILYALTLVTTIGYGHFTCRTITGKLTTILYSIIGIPILAVFLTKIGNSEANLVRFVYAKLCCGCWKYKGKRKQKVSVRKKTSSNKSSFSSRKSSSNNSSNSNNGADTNLAAKSEDTPGSEMHLASNLANSVETDNNSSTDQNLADDDENQVIYIDQPINYSLIRVPISLTLFILTTYVMLGGALFMAIEGWTFLDGVYFSFITLSTIGLGDLVPGKSMETGSVDEFDAEWKVLGVFFYLIIGLSLIMMGFNLMQETVVSWSESLAARFGIIDDYDDVEDEKVQGLNFIVCSMAGKQQSILLNSMSKAT